MREVVQSFFRFSSSMFLLGLQGFMSMFSLRNVSFASDSTIEGPWLSDGLIHTFQDSVAPPTEVVNSRGASRSADAPANGTAQRPEQELTSASTAANAHTGWVPMPGMTQSAADPPGTGSQPGTSSSQPQVNSGSLNTARFVVMGEGLAAGIGNFTLSSDSQQWSFATQMAKQMGVKCRQRLIQAPGIGNLVGFPPLPVCVPAPSQSTVIDQLPPEAVSNLAVPSLTLNDALNLQTV